MRLVAATAHLQESLEHLVQGGTVSRAGGRRNRMSGNHLPLLVALPLTRVGTLGVLGVQNQEPFF